MPRRVSVLPLSLPSGRQIGDCMKSGISVKQMIYADDFRQLLLIVFSSAKALPITICP